jgi:hypothetical protein
MENVQKISVNSVQMGFFICEGKCETRVHLVRRSLSWPIVPAPDDDDDDDEYGAVG